MEMVISALIIGLSAIVCAFLWYRAYQNRSKETILNYQRRSSSYAAIATGMNTILQHIADGHLTIGIKHQEVKPQPAPKSPETIEQEKKKAEEIIEARLGGKKDDTKRVSNKARS